MRHPRPHAATLRRRSSSPDSRHKNAGRDADDDEGAADIVGPTGEEMVDAQHDGVEVPDSLVPGGDRRRLAGRWPSLIGWVALCLGAGLASGQAGSPDSAWFRTLDRPPWQPPDVVFAPVWTVLYVMMGVAAWRIWWLGRRADLGWFAAQLVANVAWTPLFFGARRLDLALADLLVLWGLVAIVTVRFLRRDRVAGVLMLPYWAWVTFAAALNLELVRRNL
jgi:tryptophan-rich sensory protein